MGFEISQTWLVKVLDVVMILPQVHLRNVFRTRDERKKSFFFPFFPQPGSPSLAFPRVTSSMAAPLSRGTDCLLSRNMSYSRLPYSLWTFNQLGLLGCGLPIVDISWVVTIQWALPICCTVRLLSRISRGTRNFMAFPQFERLGASEEDRAKNNSSYHSLAPCSKIRFVLSRANILFFIEATKACRFW